VSRKVPEPFTLVIFGASGDLARRKLVPAVYGLFRDGLLPAGFSLVGYARTAKTDEGFRAEMREATRQFVRSGAFDEKTWGNFAAAMHYQTATYDAAGLKLLREKLAATSSRSGAPGNVLFDLATPPTVFVPIVAALPEAGLVRPQEQGAPWSRIIVEKPFGRDLESACELNRQIGRVFLENQVFRIDHYLGKETVQNILVLRFANAIFEPIWNRKYVDHVQIAVSETVGVERRGRYYDQAGALRDILQNHMMHLLSLMAMEPPVALDADAVRDEKVKLLRSLRPIPRQCVPDDVVRAQYAAGTCCGEEVVGYLEEEGVAADSRTETYVALKTFVDNWRWEGVPFYLRTGKRLAARVTDIAIHFKSVPRVLFGAAGGETLEPNVLTIRIQPNEGISLRFQVKLPGPAVEIRPFQMDFGYVSAFGREPPDPYERLLLDAALGDRTLFIRNDEVEAAWCFVTPLIEACKEQKTARLPTYPAGSWGPKEADALIEADGRRWEITERPMKRERHC